MIEIRNISKTFGRVEALKPVSIDIEDGASFALLGRNGAGKTTLMKIALDLVRPDRGEVLLNGLASSRSISRRGVRYLPEHVSFPPWATPGILYRQVERLRGETDPRDFLQSCSELGCDKLLERPTGKMSRGQRQRVALALVSCGKPRLLMLDEPSTGLDPEGRIMVRNLLRRKTSQGVTTMLNSHLLGEVESVCSTAAFIRDGRLIGHGRLAEMSRSTGQVEVETTDTQELRAHLESRYRCAVDAEGRTLRVKLGPKDDFQRLTEEVLRSDIGFTGIRLMKESLEDIFLRVMSETEEDDVSQQP
ncbi:ATP-binding cassette domain-containing protein [Candidatus Fermentibacteria bacterium]|nr:ATP-binding cassette domain-containing protein [Candidatus Fermentibacteria bacterium]